MKSDVAERSIEAAIYYLKQALEWSDHPPAQEYYVQQALMSLQKDPDNHS